MKTCSKCGDKFPETEEYFRKKKSGRNGFGAKCKVCLAELSKEWREDNKERRKIYCEDNKEAISEQRKRYRAINKDTLAKYGRQWHKDHKEHEKVYCKINKVAIAERHKLWYENTKEVRLKYCKQYRDNNPEKRARTCKSWDKRNKPLIILKSQRRRARERRLPSTLTLMQWELIKETFNSECCYCGMKLPLEQEHFVPLSKGGEYTVNNIVPACRSCNKSKGAKDFGVWYPFQLYYSKLREQKILKYLNYKNDTQQFSLAF